MSTDDYTSQILVDKTGLVILSGYAIKVAVWRDRLRLEDGACETRRASDFDRATCGIKRLVVITAGGGYISLDALQWLQDIGAGVLVIGRGDAVLMASVSRLLDHP